jgi:LysR family transcriptional regulator, transcription activator of glutamate synthase operon
MYILQDYHIAFVVYIQFYLLYDLFHIGIDDWSGIMEIDYLCEFAVIARLGSFSLAAEELFISQSSLSKHIMALEKELNIQLFNRTSRKVTLSEAGTQFLPYANQCQEIKKRMLNIQAGQISGKNQTVNIASIPVMAQYGITGVISRFQKEHPEINLSVSEHETHQILRLVESGECELAFTRESKEESQILEYNPFYKDYLVAVLPGTHPLATEKTISLTQLKKSEFLFLDKGTTLYNLCFEACSNSGFMPKIKYTGRRPENIIDLVSQGMGIALLMKRHTNYFKHPGVSCVDVTPAVESTICLARLKNRNLSSGARIFWEYIKSLNLS